MHVTLRHGLRRDGTSQRTAVMRPITGLAEAALADLPSHASLAARVTAVLAETTARIGPRAPTPDDLRALTVGDRERLAAAALEATFGPALDAVVRCDTCGAVMDLGLDLRELVPAPEAAGPDGERPCEFELPLDDEAGGGQVRFRLPGGADLESVAPLAKVDGARAADALVDRCVVAVRSGAGRDLTPADLGADARRALEGAFARLDPDSDLRLSIACPECGAQVSAQLDLGGFLVALLGDAADVFADVYRIARAYRWSEADILALPLPRRRRYLAVLADGPEAP